MASINKVIIVGRLGQDPEIRQFQNGGIVASFSVATSEKWTDKNTGEKKEQTEWHRVSLYNRLAEIARDYLRKGALVYIEGSIHTRKYTDQQGIERYSTEIKGNELRMLSSQDSQNSYQNAQQSGYGQQGYQGQQYAQQPPQGQQGQTWTAQQPNGYNRGFARPEQVGYQNDGYGNLVPIQNAPAPSPTAPSGQISDDDMLF